MGQRRPDEPPDLLDLFEGFRALGFADFAACLALLADLPAGRRAGAGAERRELAAGFPAAFLGAAARLAGDFGALRWAGRVADGELLVAGRTALASRVLDARDGAGLTAAARPFDLAAGRAGDLAARPVLLEARLTAVFLGVDLGGLRAAVVALPAACRAAGLAACAFAAGLRGRVGVATGLAAGRDGALADDLAATATAALAGVFAGLFTALLVGPVVALLTGAEAPAGGAGLAV